MSGIKFNDRSMVGDKCGAVGLCRWFLSDYADCVQGCDTRPCV